MTATEDLPRVMEVFGKTAPRRSSALLIVGAGNIGLHVAQNARGATSGRPGSRSSSSSRARAEVAADALKRTVVLNGDGLDLELLEEANVAAMDAVLALTDDDKTNILACVRAKTEGAKLVVALVNDPSLIGLIAPMGIDAYVNPRSTTVSSILRYVRHGRIRAVYSIGDGEAEVIEAQVLGTSAIAGKAVRDAELPEASLIGLIQKGDKVVVPQGRHPARRGRRPDDLRHARLGRRGRAAVPGRPGLLLMPCASLRQFPGLRRPAPHRRRR